MSLLFLRLGILLCLLPAFVCGEESSFRVATYNIRSDAQMDRESGNAWSTRKHEIAKLIDRHGFDLLGTQEPDKRQVAELQELLPGFTHVARPYGGREGESHHCATFYKQELFELADSGVFWLSETPDVPSIGWDATDRRICLWTKLVHKPDRRVCFVFNTHFYWKNQTARRHSGEVLVKMIREIAGNNPVIALGDFNSTPQTAQIQEIKKLLSDAFSVAQTPREGPENTSFPGGVFQGQPKARIDYLFVSGHFAVRDYRVLPDIYDGNRHPSDHLPVTSVLEWQAAPAR